MIPYRRAEGTARTMIQAFVVAAVSAAVLLAGDLATPTHPATQLVEWVTR